MAAITQAVAPVPSITQQALASIADPNVAAVLQQLVTGWQVRNGQSGDGSNAFLTRGDLGLAASTGGVGGSSGSSSLTAGGAFLKSGVVTALINAITASVLADPFYQSLGTPISQIDITLQKQKAGILNVGAAVAVETENRVTGDTALLSTMTTQFATVNGNVSALQTTLTTVTNSVAANTSAITTLQSNVGSLNVSLSQESTTRANADGALQAQWTVKTDINGYISGFGLASTANNAAPSSAFYVRADTFAIGSPSGPGIAPAVPFVVYTTPQSIGGQTVPPGVYMANAMIANGTINNALIALATITQANMANASIGTAQIQNAAIGNAQIGFAAIDSLRLAGRCVTVQASYTSSTNINITYTSSGGNLLIFANGNGGAELFVDGVNTGGWGDAGTHVDALISLAAGNHTFGVTPGSAGCQLVIFEAFH
jgi:hypothetical protein